MVAQSGGSTTLTAVSDQIQLRGAPVPAPYFDIFRIKTALGRTFLADEDQPGKDNVVVLSRVLWANQFGADPAC
jgi:putative ABC transport system permease protein